MAQSIPPLRLDSLGGVFTGGNVFRRPNDSAVRCHNMRPMPGGAVRLRGGWKRRTAGVPETYYRQIHEFRRGTFSGGIFHIAQTSGAATDKWQRLNLADYSLTELETIAGLSTFDTRAITTVRDCCFWDNGLGIRDATSSRPALSCWDGEHVRYVGLDAWVPGGLPPTLAAISVPGFNNSTFLYHVDIWMGLYNKAHNHFSNGIKLGRLAPMSGAAIVVQHPERLTYAYHNVEELSDLYYVFYATGDGLEVPYLILNTDGSDIYRVGVGGTGDIMISIAPDPAEGFYVSAAHEMPTENFPPRPISDMCYQNGRVYYIPKEGGQGDPETYGGFTYIVDDHDAPSVGWSASADDSVETEFVGKPEESYPLTNRKFVPSGERPLKVAALSNRGQVLVLTATQSFWLEETVDGLHVFQRISENRGLLDRRSYVRTPRGPMWITQHREIVLLHEDSMSLEVLSGNYSELLAQNNYPFEQLGVAADYLLDPPHMIDRYQAWASNGWFVIHDFRLEQDQEMREVTVAPAYSGMASVITAARTVRDGDGKTHHITANIAVWTQEGQPDVEAIPAVDYLSSGVIVQIEGEWISQWMDFGDPLVRKEIAELYLIGDCAHSMQLNDKPLQLFWYSDLHNALPGVTDNISSIAKHDQSPTDLSFIGKISDPHMRWIKFRCVVRGHADDLESPYYPYALSNTGELNVSHQIYGSLAQMAITMNSSGGNR